ncbi:MAG: DUF5340 domain-containing protein [Cyanobacteriota bacterium]|nr:DUF5340 domain-containing protein [Cyanobacteriota bacterium]
MEPIPIPARVQYELLLQMLEKKTIMAVERNSIQYEQVNQLIVTLRKALAIQKQLEDSCQQANLPVEHRWSLNEMKNE